MPPLDLLPELTEEQESKCAEIEKRKVINARKNAGRRNWLTLHRAHERILARPVYYMFREQGKRIAKTIAAGSPARFALESFSVGTETQELLQELSPRLERTMLIGALSMRESISMKKWMDGDDLSRYAIDLPSTIISGIRAAMRELVAQKYWSSIAQWSKQNMAKIIDAGIQAGASNKEIAKRLRSATSGNLAKQRALVIARSEVTGALNRGHLESLNELASHEPAKKRWSAILDQRTRDSHAQLSGQSIPVDEKFSNGGRFPGDPFLPASERANCRCVLIADVSLF